MFILHIFLFDEVMGECLSGSSTVKLPHPNVRGSAVPDDDGGDSLAHSGKAECVLQQAV